MAYEVTGGRVVASSLSCKNCPYFKVSKKAFQKNNPQCQFDKPANGGFKGTRPHYIKYRIITDAVENHSAKEDFMLCTNWTENMQRRAAFGAAQRAEGKDGEIIKIVGQEGDPIELRTNVAVNSLGEIVKPNAELAKRLEDSGYVIAPDTRSVAVENKEIVYKTVVPNYELEQRKIKGYSDAILKRELDESTAAEDEDDAKWERARAKVREKGDFMPPTPGMAVAEPVKRGPGRPPKSEGNGEA